MSKSVYSHNRGEVFFAIFMIVAGLFFLVGNLTDINFGRYFWPLLLIGLGAWLIAKPRLSSENMAVTQHFIGEFDRRGHWVVEDEAFKSFVFDGSLDMTKAEIPIGETSLKFEAFVGDIDLFVPADVGVAVRASGFVNEFALDAYKEETFLGAIDYATDNFKLAERRIRIESNGFVNEITVRRI